MVKTHWMTWTRFYYIFDHLYQRCNNPNNPSYKNYWWRWIQNLWNSFEEFYNDMYPNYIKHCNEYWEKNTTLDRIDVNWSYCKDNCRWATRKEQMRNRTDTYWVHYKWKTYSLKDLSELLWIKYSTLRDRVYAWRKEESLALEKQKGPKAVEVWWKKYNSLKELASDIWIKYSTLKRRIWLWRSLEKAATPTLLRHHNNFISNE